MQAVVLSIHLILALALIIVVLLQRSEGGALGMGGGGVMTSRGAWMIGAAFVVTSLALTVLAARDSRSNSVIDGIDTSAPVTSTPAMPDLGTDLLPKVPGSTDGPATPPAPADATSTQPAATDTATPPAAPDTAPSTPATGDAPATPPAPAQ